MRTLDTTPMCSQFAALADFVEARNQETPIVGADAVLRHCREMLALWDAPPFDRRASPTGREMYAARITLEMMAAIHSDHPDYRIPEWPEWMPVVESRNYVTGRFEAVRDARHWWQPRWRGLAYRTDGSANLGPYRWTEDAALRAITEWAREQMRWG